MVVPPYAALPASIAVEELLRLPRLEVEAKDVQERRTRRVRPRRSPRRPCDRRREEEEDALVAGASRRSSARSIGQGDDALVDVVEVDAAPARVASSRPSVLPLSASCPSPCHPLGGLRLLLVAPCLRAPPCPCASRPPRRSRGRPAMRRPSEHHGVDAARAGRPIERHLEPPWPRPDVGAARGTRGTCRSCRSAADDASLRPSVTWWIFLSSTE